MTPRNPIYALCARPEAAEKSVRALVSAGIVIDDIIVISSEPLDHYHVPRRNKIALPWLVVCGATLGGIAGFLLSTLTQASYPIATGGMRVVTFWTDGIIIYELTMLGAILSTILIFLLTSTLLEWRGLPIEPEVSAGKVLVGVAAVPQKLRERITELLSTFGEVKLYS